MVDVHDIKRWDPCDAVIKAEIGWRSLNLLFLIGASVPSISSPRTGLQLSFAVYRCVVDRCHATFNIQILS